jgi:hypothetical protein
MPIYMDRHYVEGATAHAVAIAHTLILPFRMSIGSGLDLLVRRGLVHGLLYGRLAGPGNHQASPPGVARPGPRTRSSRSTQLWWRHFSVGSRTRLLPTPCTWRSRSTRPSG